MQICLIVPGPLAKVSGSHHYARRMANALREAGHDLRIIALDGRLPDPDQAAIYAARTAWADLPANCLKLIDGIALPAFDGLPLNQVTALIHHPASLETGIGDDARQRLHTTEAAMFHNLPRLVATSEQTADRLVKDFSLPRDRIAIVAPGIDDLPRSTGSGGPCCRILAVGHLIPRKGYDILLHALSRLFDLNWHLTIVGAGNDQVHADGLRALADDLHIAQHVEFAGQLDDVALEEQWRTADLFAATPHFEGYGMALAEALRRGLPVAATNTGAVPVLVGPEAGVVCAPGDIEQLSKALRRLIFDRPLLLDMAEVAWQSGQSLPSWNEQATRLAAVLAE